MGKSFLLGLCLLAGCAAAHAASGQRNAMDAARVAWLLERGPSQSTCEPSVTALTSYGFEVRCGEAARYVRCDYSSEGTCCWPVPSREQATRGVVVSSGTLKVCN
jgi:hypothetical protein